MNAIGKVLSRREAISEILLGGASLLALNHKTVAIDRPAAAPDLTPAEILSIESAIGKKGRYVEAEKLYTVPLPRNDLKVSIKGEPVPISFGFGGWVSIKKTTDWKNAVLMSDTVLLADEVNPLISAAEDNGLEISAIHNHFFYEDPRIVYMHVHGVGDVATLAKSYASAIKNTKLWPANQPTAGPAATQTAKEIFDLQALDKIVGFSGSVNGTTYKYTVGRTDQNVTAMGAEITTNIGLNSWAAFAGTRDNAHVAGDMAMLESEVNNVVRSLRRNGIEVVALHHHMLGESPKIIFLHYYGRGESISLAKGFRAALDELGKKHSAMTM
jgi:hypothetical protein